MTYRFTIAAKLDMLDARDFYDDQQMALGSEFLVDLGIGLSRVLEAPHRWPMVDTQHHRYRLNRFPFAIVYRLLQSNLWK